MLEKEKEWLASLKVGDEVCYSSYRSNYTISKVKKITPTGQIVLENGNRFKEGVYRSGTGAWATLYRLKPVTEEIREKILRTKLINVIGDTNLHGLTLQQLKDIYTIIRKEGETDGEKS